MAMDDTSGPAVLAARAAIRSALIAFTTSTLPTLATTLNGAVLAADPLYPLLASTKDGALYQACKIYVDRLIAEGAYSGAPLPLR